MHARPAAAAGLSPCADAADPIDDADDADETPAPGRELRLGGMTPFTSIDFPGRLAAVLFVQGCPWRCGYCHNPHLQSRAGPSALAWRDTLAWLQRRAGLIDGVVFSGGEPTVDPMLGAAMDEVRALGYAIGLHTAGTHPRRLASVLPRVDWVGIDVKAPLSDTLTDTPTDTPADALLYDRITGRPNSARSAADCLAAVLRSGVDHEVRTTIHPSWLDDAALRRLGDDLARRGVRKLALQIARSTEQASFPPAIDYPSSATLERLRQQFPSFTLRHG